MISKLKQLRYDRGISQEKCAKEVGISVKTLQRYENAEYREYNGTIYVLKKLADYYNVGLEELLTNNNSDL